MSTAPFLGFDLLEEAQALKHVTINEALLAIDTFLDDLAIADISGLQTALDGKAASSHSHAWSAIVSGLPTTLSGYGISDAVALAGNQAIAGVKTFSSAPNLSSLTGSRPLSLDASKNIQSPTAADFNTSIGLGTASNVQFGGIGIGTAGVAGRLRVGQAPFGTHDGAGISFTPLHSIGIDSDSTTGLQVVADDDMFNGRLTQFVDTTNLRLGLSAFWSTGAWRMQFRMPSGFAELTSAGQWLLPTVGSTGGILLGGDFLLHRHATDANVGVIASGDSLQLDNLTASRLVELDANKRLASVGFASSDVARLSQAVSFASNITAAGTFIASRPNVGDNGYWAKITTDSQPRFRVTAGGLLEFGPGGADSPDVKLDRQGANVLRLATGDSFQLDELTASARVRTDVSKRLESVTGDAIFSDSGVPLQFGTIDTMPSGADSAEGWIAAPYSPADGTTSMTMRIRGIRVYCTGGTTTNSATFIIEKSSDGGQTWAEVGGAANTSTTVASASRTGSKTSFGATPSFASGDLLRVSGSGGSGREDIILALDCQRTA